jgi:hypothetical protein
VGVRLVEAESNWEKFDDKRKIIIYNILDILQNSFAKNPSIMERLH